MILKRVYLLLILSMSTLQIFAADDEIIDIRKQLLNREFQAILKKDTVIVNIKTKESVVVPQTIKVKARQHKIGGQYSDIYTITGKKKYFTLTSNLVSIEADEKLAPQVDPLTVYDYSGDIIHYNKLFETLTFIDYQLSFITTRYYAEIYRGTSSAAVENQFGLKQYFSHPKIPVDFGIATTVHRGFWNDNVGTITWNSIFVGPTLHTILWDTDGGGALHLHVSALKSILHESKFPPDTHSFSSNLLRIELSQSFKMKYGHFTFGGALNFMQSSIVETSEYLETNGKRDNIVGIGVTLGFYRPWILDL